jgi:tocopherol O-methyltransferase
MIRTDQPVIAHRERITRKITQFWDQLSESWKTVWGPHIHHGYYENNQPISPQDAQVQLIKHLANLLQIPYGVTILDVGCGMGGSSMYLAKEYHAKVIGITLSQKQVAMATQQAKEMNIQDVHFKVEDALSLESIADHSMDIVWSLESCEQFFDKQLFIKQVSRVLKPGGKFMLATWCSSQPEYAGQSEKKYKKLCLAFDLPYMPTMDYYRTLLLNQHFALNASVDWSSFVMKSWEIGLSLVNAYSLLQMLRMGGWRGLRFAKQISLMRDAFQQDSIRYGVFVATKTI